MATSKIRQDVLNKYYATDEVKTWFDSSLIGFEDNATISIGITNNIAFVRLDGIKIKQAMSLTTKIIDGNMPQATQTSYVRGYVGSNPSKNFIFRIYRNTKDLYLVTTGYTANEVLEGITFSYPVG